MSPCFRDTGVFASALRLTFVTPRLHFVPLYVLIPFQVALRYVRMITLGLDALGRPLMVTMMLSVVSEALTC